LAEQLGFSEFLIISSDFEKRNSRKNEKLLKDAVEAFLGAIEKDFDEKPDLNLSKKGYPPYLGFGY
jgi:dsRNA-specific ribonuclease